MSPRVGVCGLGLIGGSLLLGLRDAGLAVRGCDVWPDPRTWCESLGVPADGSPEATARQVDVLVVCVPPHATAAVVAAALVASPDVVVLDAASVKLPVVDEVARRAGPDAARFLPGHPLAGAERGGHDAAEAELLRGAPWAICPPPVDGDRPLEPLVTVAPVLEALDARLLACEADEHDDALAASSHAPHLVAGAAARIAAEPPAGGPLATALSGGALRDVTRVAGAPVGLWGEVLHANAVPTAEVLDATAEHLRAAANALRAGDRDRLHALWNAGVAAQDAIQAARWQPLTWQPAELDARWSALLDLGRAGVAVRWPRIVGDRLRLERTVPATR